MIEKRCGNASLFYRCAVYTHKLSQEKIFTSFLQKTVFTLYISDFLTKIKK